MNLKLKRTSYTAAGVFGVLLDENANLVAYTLEHAYSHDGGAAGPWVPKVAPGVYQCQRHAPNRLPYETFELQNVPDFQGKRVMGILIHILNFNRESDGCIGVGLDISPDGQAIENSTAAFKKVMGLQNGIDTFALSILA